MGGHGGQPFPQRQAFPCWQPQPHSDGTEGVWQPHWQAAPMQGLQAQVLVGVSIRLVLGSMRAGSGQQGKVWAVLVLMS